MLLCLWCFCIAAGLCHICTEEQLLLIWDLHSRLSSPCFIMKYLFYFLFLSVHASGLQQQRERMPAWIICSRKVWTAFTKTLINLSINKMPNKCQHCRGVFTCITETQFKITFSWLLFGAAETDAFRAISVCTGTHWDHYDRCCSRSKHLDL